ncbi:MAG: tyrosine-type recombinase/integrase [Methylohalobius sp. ZOD2]
MNAVLELPNPDHRDYFLLVLLTGLRRNEALNLTWADVDLPAKTLTARDTNHREHTLPLSDYLVDMLIRRQTAPPAPRPMAGAPTTGAGSRGGRGGWISRARRWR